MHLHTNLCSSSPVPTGWQKTWVLLGCWCKARSSTGIWWIPSSWPVSSGVVGVLPDMGNSLSANPRTITRKMAVDPSWQFLYLIKGLLRLANFGNGPLLGLPGLTCCWWGVPGASPGCSVLWCPIFYSFLNQLATYIYWKWNLYFCQRYLLSRLKPVKGSEKISAESIVSINNFICM